MASKIRTRDFLTAEELQLLGEVAAESAQLESTIGFMIMLILNLDELQHDAVVGGMSYGARLDTLKKIGATKIKSEQDQVEFTALIGHLKDLGNKRNIAIHGAWGPEGGLTLDVLSALNDGTYQPLPAVALNPRNQRTLKADELEKLVTELLEGGTNLWRFAKCYWIPSAWDKVRKDERPQTLADIKT